MEKKKENMYGLKSDKGVVLLVVLILSAVALAVMTALLYMVTTGTQISGMEKRYKTAKEAAFGGFNMLSHSFNFQGEAADISKYEAELNTTMNATLDNTDAACSASLYGTNYTRLAAKIMTPTSNWVSCNSDLTVGPSSYDMKFEIGTSPKYTVYAKIVSTIEGNTGGNPGLLTKGVVASGGGEVPVAPMPYLYAVEINAENASNPAERAKLTVLYQY